MKLTEAQWPLGGLFSHMIFLCIIVTFTVGWEFLGEGMMPSMLINSLLLGQVECQLPGQLRRSLRVLENGQEG